MNVSHLLANRSQIIFFCFAGSGESYKTDSKAFIFSLNYGSQGSLFKKKVSKFSSSSAIFSSQSTGPMFGEAPFDFQIGINGTMKDGSSHHIISYTNDSNFKESNLGTVLAGASNFTVSDVEVLYKGEGGTLISCIVFFKKRRCLRAYLHKVNLFLLKRHIYCLQPNHLGEEGGESLEFFGRGVRHGSLFRYLSQTWPLKTLTNRDFESTPTKTFL